MRRLPNHLAPGRTRWMLALLIAIGSGATAASAQDPLKVLPNNYKQIFDNADVTVIRAHYGPHERIPVHDHSSYATVFVYLNDSGAVRIDHEEQGEKPVSVVRPPTVKGSYRIAPGMNERHSIENLGDTSSEFLRVELKRVSLQIKEPFRGKAPESLSGNLDKVEFTEPALQIERIICTGPSPCTVESSQYPSLIIAFTPLYLVTKVFQGETELETGTVQWLTSSQDAKITPSAVPAHILRILFTSISR